MDFNVLWFPIIISTVLFMPFGAFLYSENGLGNLWMSAIGKSKEEIKDESTNMPLIIGGTIILAFLTVFLVGVLVSTIGITTAVDLLTLLLVVYFIILTLRLKNVLFDGNFKLFIVNLLGTLGEFVIVFVVFLLFI